MLDQDISG